MSKKFNDTFFFLGVILFLISGFIGCGKLTFNDLADTEKIITFIMTAFDFLMVFVNTITRSISYLMHQYSALLDAFVKVLEIDDEEKPVEEKKD